MKKKVISLGLSLCLSMFQFVVMVVCGVSPAYGGGSMDTLDITGRVPSPIPGQIIANVVPIQWDIRAIPVVYSMNTTLDPIPNPLGTPFLSVAEAKTVLQKAFDEWNNIKTSYIDMKIEKTTNNPGLRGFDFVNELTFRSNLPTGVIASSPSFSLPEDSNFEDGDDIDGDGDSDVSKYITKTNDYDGDGDIEFPAGFYKAGTMLDNDVQFNTKENGYRFTINDADIDTNYSSIDLLAIATHEFGHSHGVSHTLTNQISDTDGTGATMFPFFDTGDPDDELGFRSLSEDDIAWSSYKYQEGTSWDADNPAYAWKNGDIPFEKKYGVIKGELKHGWNNDPIAGGELFAVKKDTNTVVASGFSGTSRYSFNTANGSRWLISPLWNIPNGKYTIPVPKGLYNVGVQPVDGIPVAAGSIGNNVLIGSSFGQLNFVEEFYNKCKEDAREARLGDRQSILVLPGWEVPGIDIITSDVISINNFGPRTGSGFIDVPAGSIYAVRVTASQIASINPGGHILIQGLGLETAAFDGSVVPVFANAMLTSGKINPDSTISVDLTNPIVSKPGFIGQYRDTTPFYFHNPKWVGKKVMEGINSGTITDLFLVVQIPTTTPFPGIHGQPPLVGLGRGGAPSMSYYSLDSGASWIPYPPFIQPAPLPPLPRNFRFSLITSLPLTGE